MPAFSSVKLQNYDIEHYKRIERHAQKVHAIYVSAIREAAAIGSAIKSVDPNKPFSFDDYPATKAKAEKLFSEISVQIISAIEQAEEAEWLFANSKNDSLVDSILSTSKLSKAQISQFKQPNLSALKAFQNRKFDNDGLGLSDRVWKYVQQFKSEIEMGLDLGIGSGKSAAALSRDLKQYLQAPDKLFRRVRDKHGNLRLSKHAKAYHPGQGVYRSSHKNVMRLTRSEINMAYRSSDYERWQQLDFVVGIEVKLSNNHPEKDICDRLQGKYPKEFKFRGWHPHCRCHAISILATADEIEELSNKIMNDEDTSNFVSVNTVKKVPNGFTDWVEANKDRANTAKSMPYFIKDNFKEGDLEKGLKFVNNNEKQLSKKIAKTSKQEAKDLVGELLGTRKGNPMSFEEANELKGNIDYLKNGEYKVNCQSCVVANELRRRGYDVTAMPNTKREGNIPYMLSRNTEKAWVDPKTGKTPEKLTAGGQREYVNSYSLKLKPKKLSSISKDLNEFTKEVGRYHIDFYWKGARSGHIITLERLETGIVRLYDPQNGELVRWADLAKQISPAYGIDILRVDNLSINTEIISGIVRKL